MNSFSSKKARKGIFMTSQNAISLYFYVQLTKQLETLIAQLTGVNAAAGTQYCTCAAVILTVFDCGRGVSKERESVYAIWNVPAE